MYLLDLGSTPQRKVQQQNYKVPPLLNEIVYHIKLDSLGFIYKLNIYFMKIYGIFFTAKICGVISFS